LLQGIVFGLVGAGMAGILSAGCRRFVKQTLANQPNVLQTLADGIQLTSSQTILLPVVLISFVIFVGFTGSLFAVRRYILR